MTIENYRSFLEAKAKVAKRAGIEIDDALLHPSLFEKPHQADIVKWAAAGGKRAIFADFGLGKTAIQLSLCDAITKSIGGKALIVVPLNVRSEFKEDGERLGIRTKFIRSVADAEEGVVSITNYETVRDGKIDPSEFTVASLDEASCLRSYGSDTYQTFLPRFSRVPYRFVATATPSPNEFTELTHYAEFLGVMDKGEALTRFFKRDSTKAGNLTLYGHKKREFWLWVSSWAVMLQRPSDLGYPDEGYDLPALNVHWHEVTADISGEGMIDSWGQGQLIKNAAKSLMEVSRERRSGMPARLDRMQEIVEASPEKSFVIWHDLEREREDITKRISGCKAVFGSQDMEEREQVMLDFKRGDLRLMAAKPVMAGSGCNFQKNCHTAIFCGVGYKFNDFIQAIHRIYRFLQTENVDIHIIYTENEREIRRGLEGKWARHTEMRGVMTSLIREFGIGNLHLANEMRRAIGCARTEATGRDWTFVNNDCVEEAAGMADESVGMIITSVPFSNHYEYTPSYNDFGHTDDNKHFFEQMDFLTPNLLRVLKPGRMACIHVKDRILYGNMTGKGVPTVSPFHAECIFHYIKHGFDYLGMITVNTDVVRENNQTYRLGYTEMCKDGSKMGVGSPEYVLLMRKPQSDRSKAYADERIAKSKSDYSLARWQLDAHAFWRSSGDRLLSSSEWCAMPSNAREKAWAKFSKDAVYDFKDHLAITDELVASDALAKKFMMFSPRATGPDVWDDVNRMFTLNSRQSYRAREQHVCPFQLDIVERLIDRWSGPGDVVFDPFGGVGSVPYTALKKGRKGYGCELNSEYFKDAVFYLEVMEEKLAMPGLFDAIDAEAATRDSADDQTEDDAEYADFDEEA
jgi:DNA modification methylase